MKEYELSDDIFLDMHDLIKILRVSRSTIIRWNKQKSIPSSIKISGRIFWLKKDIEEWLKNLKNK